VALPMEWCGHDAWKKGTRWEKMIGFGWICVDFARQIHGFSEVAVTFLVKSMSFNDVYWVNSPKDGENLPS
jgi:hypothetical protein